MDIREFLDELYQVWSKTTGAEGSYWMPEEFAELFDGYEITSVRQDDHKETVAHHMTEADADFITAIHGALPDLIRRFQDALDEADRLDTGLDEAQGRIYELELELAGLKGTNL